MGILNNALKTMVLKEECYFKQNDKNQHGILCGQLGCACKVTAHLVFFNMHTQLKDILK